MTGQPELKIDLADRKSPPRPKKRRWLWSVLLLGLFMLLLLLIGGAAGSFYLLWHYSRDLPDYQQLADYEPPTTTRIHAGDGRLIAEYAREKRMFVPIEAMPKELVYGFVAVEDQRFFEHEGVDPVALFRAVLTNIYYAATDRRLIGASTITQQVAKNFLLTNEFSLARKIKEALLALRIEKAYSKERILELYLNEIYLGGGTYGVAAAALNYFDKSLDDLTIAEIAYLAALPKAPNNYHPIRNHDAALERRNWVITRMEEEGYISSQAMTLALAEPLTAHPRSGPDSADARYFVEEVRQILESQYGVGELREGGLSVRTTLDPELQRIARDALRQGLEDYDRRHGWRGPVARVDTGFGWPGLLRAVPQPVGTEHWTLALVLSLEEKAATIGFSNGQRGRIPLEQMKWARPPLDNGMLGPVVKKPSDVLSTGDVVLVELVQRQDRADETSYAPDLYALRQIPEVNGALVALDPHTGRVLALTGGWSFARSQFNRATQAQRQPGSAFKPFVYLAALEKGYTPATIILDAPFVLEQGPDQPKWKPDNFSKKFYGPSPMRTGIEKSRNLMTVRLAQAIGMDTVADYAERFHLANHLPRHLSMALGAGEVTLMNLTAAYGMLVNGGREITPALIDRAQDRYGKTIFKHDHRPCIGCRADMWRGQAVPAIPDPRRRLADPISAYQVVTMLEGVIQRGTGRQIRTVGKPLAGKTGTSNESRDTWFIGFSPDLAVGVYVGFDVPQSLGNTPWGSQETGSSVAAPIFKVFMERALSKRPTVPFRTPPGVRMVRIDASTGTLATPDSGKVIVEAFRAGTEPQENSAAVFIGNSGPQQLRSSGGSRGLY